jgi:hypothetical protein
MARDYPKRKSWANVYDELSKFGEKLNRPPEPPAGGEDWERNRCWQDTVDWAKSNNVVELIENLSAVDYYATSPFSSCKTRREDFSGEIGELLKTLNAETRWNKTKNGLVRQLISTLKASGYISFSGHGPTYPISTVGSSFICEVPMSKQGNLKPFRGQIIRVICTGSGSHTDRQYMAGPYSAEK